MKIVELELPTKLGDCYVFTKEDEAVVCAKNIGTDCIYKVKTNTQVLWKVEKEE